MTASSNIPDGISFGELEKLAENAPSDNQPDLSFEQRCEQLSERLLDQAADEIKDPMIHKEMLLEICRRMIHWHTAIGEQMFEKGNEDAGVAWLRDAGKFQAAMAIVHGVTLGPDDWTCTCD